MAYSALILRTRASGESNREVWMLSAEEGILRATVFGGPKSKLRSHAAPFHSGRALIYHDPVRDTRKLSEFDVQFWRPGLRELYERAMSADAIAETILASHGGGGNWETAMALAQTAFDAMECANEEFCTRIFILFLWRWTAFLGIQPDLNHCGRCGAETSTGTTMWYSKTENSLLCPDCVHSGQADGTEESYGVSDNFMQINPGCRRWLTTAAFLAPLELSHYTMDNKTLREAKMLTQSVLTAALGWKPASWDW